MPPYDCLFISFQADAGIISVFFAFVALYLKCPALKTFSNVKSFKKTQVFRGWEWAAERNSETAAV